VPVGHRIELTMPWAGFTVAIRATISMLPPHSAGRHVLPYSVLVSMHFLISILSRPLRYEVAGDHRTIIKQRLCSAENARRHNHAGQEAEGCHDELSMPSNLVQDGGSTVNNVSGHSGPPIMSWWFDNCRRQRTAGRRRSRAC